jgi:hypothetical protein
MTAISWLIICVFVFFRPAVEKMSYGIHIVAVCVVLPASTVFVYGVFRWMWENMI